MPWDRVVKVEVELCINNWFLILIYKSLYLSSIQFDVQILYHPHFMNNSYCNACVVLSLLYVADNNLFGSLTNEPTVWLLTIYHKVPIKFNYLEEWLCEMDQGHPLPW